MLTRSPLIDLSPPTSPARTSLRLPGSEYSCVRASLRPSLGELLPLDAILQSFPDAILIEPSHNGILPEYLERRAIRRRLERRAGASQCLVYTNPAHSAFVVSWRSGPERVYVEYLLPLRTTALELALVEEKGFLDSERSPSNKGRAKRAVMSLLAGSLISGVGVGRRRVYSDIEALAEVDQIRRAWHTLDSIRILDVGGTADGRWLISAAQALEPIHRALLSRTRSFVDEEFSVSRHRPEYLRDLRDRVDLVDDASRGRSPGAAIRRLIVRSNLFAICRTNATARATRRALGAYAGLKVGPTLYLDCNVATATREFSPNGEVGAALRVQTGPNAASELLDVRTSALRLAWRLVRERRTGPMESEPADSRAARELERRRRVLLSASGSSGTDEGGAYLHLFPWLQNAEFAPVRESVR
jgi:hypothetical protein